MLVLVEIHNEGWPPDRDRFALVELHLCNPVLYELFVPWKENGELDRLELGILKAIGWSG